MRREHRCDGLESALRFLTPAIVAVGVFATCGRNTLHTGTVSPSQTVKPPTPVAAHPDGTCDSGLAACPGDGAGFCFDLQAAPDHCGACGNACPPGVPCEDGACHITPCTSRITVKTLEVDPVQTMGYQVGVADFDRDGAIDLLLPTPNSVMIERGWTEMSKSRGVSLYRGQADGSFVIEDSFPAGFDSDYHSALAVADFNHDQIPDFVSGAAPGDIYLPPEQQTAMSVHLGNGDGTFRPAIDVRGAAAPGFVAVADLDGDGVLDLATVSYPAEAVTLWLGKGDGAFAAPQKLGVGGSPRHVMVADWNRDGILDLVANDSYLHVLLGAGQGKFAPTLDCGLTLCNGQGCPGAMPPLLADFDGDGNVDLATNNNLWLGMHDCNFTKAAAFHAPSDTAFPMAAADLNGDGALDLVVCAYQGALVDGVGYLPGDGHGKLGDIVPLDSLEVEHATCGRSFASAADFNGDGRLDLVVAGEFSVRIFMNTCQ
jgi:hypothetical protein